MPFNYEPLSIFSRTPPPQEEQLSLARATARIVAGFAVKDAPFSKEALACTPRTTDSFSITPAIRKARADFTDCCVVSIDPVDAKDLDDALHVDCLPGGQSRVAVHIADVSHFVKAASALDKEALARASSVYLKHKVRMIIDYYYRLLLIIVTSI